MMDANNWIELSWCRDGPGRKYIRVRIVGVPLIPYVRQTHRSRFRRDKFGERSQKYNDQQAMLRDALNFKMKEVNEYGNLGYAKQQLGFWARFEIADSRRLAVCDLSNLIKAVEDFCRGSLIHDDRMIFEYEQCWKRHGEEDVIEFEVFELSK